MMNTLWGKHPGARAVHAKGIVLDGFFVPTPDAAALSIAAMFKSETPIRVRFSDFTGRPDVADASPLALPHGMAMAFSPEGGIETDVIANTFAFFPVATIEEFLEFLQALAASEPGATKPTKADQFLVAHPAAAAALATAKTPSSFARQTYNGLNAFVFVDAQGKHQPFRWLFIPMAGVDLMSNDAAAEAGPDVLMNELRHRVTQGPIVFQVVAQLAEPGDQTSDSSKPWPVSRRRVVLGTIKLDHLAQNQALAQHTLELLPTQLAPGIEVSDDPMIAVRAQAYDISIGRRE